MSANLKNRSKPFIKVMIEFGKADDCQQIAEKLIELFYPELHGAEIVCVYRSKHFADSPRTIARIEKVQGFKAWLWRKADGFQDCLFVIQIVKRSFENFEPSQQIAIIDHQLSHIEISELTGEPTIQDKHDIEENRIIVKRHGAYTAGLEVFLEALQTGNENTDFRKELLEQIFG